MAQMDTIEVSGQPMRLYVDAPPDGGPYPAVIVMVHGPGLDAFIQNRVEELARHGYVAASPDVFHRQPDDGTDAMTRVGRLLDREIIADVDAAVAHLSQRADVRAGSFAIVGFCMGGRNTYLLAGARPDTWKAAGVFYGGNIMKAWGDGPAPFELTSQIRCPMLGIFGDEDTNPSPDDVKRLDAALAQPHEFHMYQGAGHAFLNFTNPQRYRPEQAADAWQKLLQFLDGRLSD